MTDLLMAIGEHAQEINRRRHEIKEQLLRQALVLQDPTRWSHLTIVETDPMVYMLAGVEWDPFDIGVASSWPTPIGFSVPEQEAYRVMFKVLGEMKDEEREAGR